MDATIILGVFIIFISLRVYFNVMAIGLLRRIFGPKRDENEEGRRLHNEELHNLYETKTVFM